MSTLETVSVGKAGDVAIPLSLRQLTGIEVGSTVMLEARDGEIVIRPISDDVEVYSPERIAEFLLSNAVDAADYARACEQVRELGLNPEKILHDPPHGI
jgi:AbrB family looped-hinge helix DNA binding protein